MIPAPLVLLVDDDRTLTSLLRERLRREGYDVQTCPDAAEAEWLVKSCEFEIILLDVVLPDRNGFELCAQMRKNGVKTPVLMLTARGDVSDRITGLKIGADDYLPKPFEVAELLARMEALRRRATHNTQATEPLFTYGDIRINFNSQSIVRGGHPVELSRREFHMLSYLIHNRGRVVLRDELLRAVWGFSKLPYTRTVDVHMWQLRRKLEEDPEEPRFLRTIRGSGYLFAPSSDANQPERGRNRQSRNPVE